MHRKKVFNSAILIQFLFIMAAFFPHNIYAALVVNRSVITYDNPAVSREDVVILNNDANENLFVQVEPFAVVNPGSEAQELVPLDITDSPEFLVTPNRLVVSPNGRSLVRFLNLLPPGSEERIYRVNLTPVAPPPELRFGDEDEVVSALQVVVAYQILVIVLPASPNPIVEVDRDGHLASFRNTGNSNYLLTDGQQCDPNNPADCQPLEDRRVYAGNNWRLTLPFDGPFTYSVRTPEGLTIEQFR